METKMRDVSRPPPPKADNTVYPMDHTPMDVSQALEHYANALDRLNPNRARYVRHLSEYAAFLVPMLDKEAV